MPIKQQLSIFDTAESGKCVRRIETDMARSFIEAIHYSRKLPSNVVDSFGLFEKGEIIGVVTYGIPASRPLCIGIAGTENADRVLELNRLAIMPDMQDGTRRNDASFLVSHSLKMLKNGTFVVSYADTAWTHVGYIYQATNFLYTGLSAKRLDCFQPDGKHPRAYDKNNHSEMYQTRSRKHRYVYLVGDKRTKREMRKQLRYPVYDKYPKGDEIRYDTSDPHIVHPNTVIRKD